MTIRKSNLIAALFVAASLISSCKSRSVDPIVTPPGVNNQLVFTVNAKTTFLQEYRDTTGGVYGKDQNNTASADTLTQTLAMKGMTFKGVDSTNMFMTTHSANTSTDTSYMYQMANGDLYANDYGMEVLNNNPTIVTLNGGKVHIGWVLQAKMNDTTGKSWTACDTVISVTNPLFGGKLPVHITDAANFVADTILTIGGESIATRHALHHVNADVTGLLGASTTVDSYISTKYGTVLNIVHSTALTGVYLNQIQGDYKVMLSHK